MDWLIQNGEVAIKSSNVFILLSQVKFLADSLGVCRPFWWGVATAVRTITFRTHRCRCNVAETHGWCETSWDWYQTNEMDKGGITISCSHHFFWPVDVFMFIIWSWFYLSVYSCTWASPQLHHRFPKLYFPLFCVDPIPLWCNRVLWVGCIRYNSFIVYVRIILMNRIYFFHNEPFNVLLIWKVKIKLSG